MLIHDIELHTFGGILEWFASKVETTLLECHKTGSSKKF